MGEGEVPRAAGKVAWTSSYWRTGKIYSERISLRVECSNVILLEQKKKKRKGTFLEREDCEIIEGKLRSDEGDRRRKKRSNVRKKKKKM